MLEWALSITDRRQHGGHGLIAIDQRLDAVARTEVKAGDAIQGGGERAVAFAGSTGSSWAKSGQTGGFAPIRPGRQPR
jgi:hypothetical protein